MALVGPTVAVYIGVAVFVNRLSGVAGRGRRRRRRRNRWGTAHSWSGGVAGAALDRIADLIPDQMPLAISGQRQFGIFGMRPMISVGSRRAFSEVSDIGTFRMSGRCQAP